MLRCSTVKYVVYKGHMACRYTSYVNLIKITVSFWPPSRLLIKWQMYKILPFTGENFKHHNIYTKYEVYWNFVHVFRPSYNPENAFIHVMRNSSRNLSAVRRIIILSTTKFSIISLHGPYRNKVWGYRLDTTGLWEDEMVYFCWHRDKLAGSIKTWHFLIRWITTKC